MNKFLLSLCCLIIFSCSTDDNEFSGYDVVSQEYSSVDSPGIDRDCPFEITSLGQDENGCCVYKVCFTPRKPKKGTYSLQGNNQSYPNTSTTRGKYEWIVKVCDGELKIQLVFNSVANEISQLVCSEILSCDPVIDCNIDVTVENQGYTSDYDCMYKICVDGIAIDAKSMSCGYTLSVNGVDQGAPFKCCWTIIVDNGETALIEIRNANGDLCYSEELVCEGNCCSDLSYEVCQDGQEIDCWQFVAKLVPEDCTDYYITLRFKNGKAKVLDPSQGSFEVCIDRNTDGYNVGVDVWFHTADCGDFNTGFFYPIEDYMDGEIGSCN